MPEPRRTSRRRHLLTLAASLLTALPLAAAAAYPESTIRLVVPYAPAGTSDLLARVLAEKLRERLGQVVIVDNRPGAGGTIGAEFVARSAPDGYTLLLTDVSVYTAAPTLYPTLRYTQAGLLPVAEVASFPQVIVTSSKSPFHTFADVLKADARSPGKLSFASSGNGTGTHLAGELLNLLSGARLTHIPYRGGGGGLNDVISGNVDLMFVGLPAAAPLIRSGQLRALAVTTKRRLGSMPQVSTVSESGVPGFEVQALQGIFAPAGMPAEAVAKLNASVTAILAEPGVQERWTALGASASARSPAEFQDRLREISGTWAEVIRKAHIKAN